MAEILKRHEIEIHKPKSDFKADGVSFNKETSFIVPTNQQNNRLIHAIFEKRTAFTDSLFYDISAWTFPLAFNLDYSALKSTNNVGALVTDIKLPLGSLKTKSSYAYLMQWHEYYTPKALNMMLQKGIRVKVGMKQFSLNNIDYDYGTIMISVQNQELNEQELFSFLAEVAEKCNLKIEMAVF